MLFQEAADAVVDRAEPRLEGLPGSGANDAEVDDGNARGTGFEASVPGGDEAGVDAEDAEPFWSRARRLRSPR